MRNKVLAKIREAGSTQDAIGAYIGLLNEKDAAWVLAKLEEAPTPSYPDPGVEADEGDYGDGERVPRGLLG